jgi:plasmid stability protein
MNLSIKNAPDDVVARLRERATKNHRSLQGELLSIIEEAVRPGQIIGPAAVLARARARGVATAESSVDIIRADRDRDG